MSDNRKVEATQRAHEGERRRGHSYVKAGPPCRYADLFPSLDSPPTVTLLGSLSRHARSSLSEDFGREVKPCFARRVIFVFNFVHGKFTKVQALRDHVHCVQLSE